jgi:phosphoserine phosphatase
MYITSGMIELKDGKIAIFDLDFVLFRPSFYSSLIQTFTSNEFPQKNVSVDNEHFIKAWSEGKISYQEYVTMITKLYIENIKTSRMNDLKNAIVPIIQDKKNFYNYPYALVNLLRKQGYYILGYSNLPNFVVTPFSKYYGFHISVANNLKTNKSISPETPAENASLQKDRMRDYLKNFSAVFSLQNSIAVAGTKNGISILEMVGRPIAFNSDTELAMYAKNKAWDTIFENYNLLSHI